jgi:drug/metabolite transporter (DMT)-like permease
LRRERGLALAETTLTAVLWGTSFPIISVGLADGVDPTVFVFLRFAAAGPLMVALAAALGKDVLSVLKHRAVWIIALCNAVGFFFQFVGQDHTDPASAALLVNLSVIFAAAGSAVMLKERLGRPRLAGVVLALAGMVLVTTKGDPALVTGGQLFGDALYLVSSVAWAGYILYDKKVTDETRWDPLAATSGVVLLTALFLLPGVTLSRGFAVPIQAWEIVGYMAVFNTALPFTLYQRGLRFLSASASALILSLEIVTAMVISAVFLDESITLLMGAGAAMILVSILLVSGGEAVGKGLTEGDGDMKAAKA